MTSKSNNKEKDKEQDIIRKKEVSAYKYSAKGTSTLYEAIILRGQPCFVTYFPDDGIKIVPYIEEITRIIRPPNAEEYPYTPYDFTDQEELRDYFRRANTTSLNDLYKKAKGFFHLYVDQDKNIMTMLSADSILSWFQDLFSIIHYSEGVGGNDVGKSSIGYTFGYTGYRVVRGTSISGANYYRILGNVEPGQCIIIEDEADNISDDPDKVKILKAGYELDAKVPKTNMNTKNQEMNWFYPYCHKIILAEKSLKIWKAKGLIDRTFTFQCRPGKVRYSIKKVVSQTINKSPELQKLFDELLDFRKLMLCYRLIHYTDDLPEIKTNVRNRDEELSTPLLQFFYGTEAFEEIREAVEFFLSQRKQRRSRSLEAALYPVLKDLINSKIDSDIVNIPLSTIWAKIITGDIIKGNQYNDNHYETHEYGPLYKNTLSKFIGDKFSCDLKHSEEGSILTFEKHKFSSYDEVYNNQAEGTNVKIDIQLVIPRPEGTEGTDSSKDGFVSFNDIEIKEEKTNLPPQPSEPSEPSAFPPKCYRCDFSNYATKGEYEYHCVTRHPGEPAYPGPADIKESGLTPQGMSWENLRCC